MGACESSASNNTATRRKSSSSNEGAENRKGGTKELKRTAEPTTATATSGSDVASESGSRGSRDTRLKQATGDVNFSQKPPAPHLAEKREAANARKQPKEEEEETAPPTPEEVENMFRVVKGVWETLTGKLSLQDIGDAFYNVLFTRNPELLETVFRTSNMKQVALSLAEMLNGAIHLLGTGEGDMEKLGEILKSLGRRHAKYGIMEYHFQFVEDAFFELLAGAVGSEDYTKEVEKSWKFVMGHIRVTFLKGLNDGIEAEENTRALFFFKVVKVTWQGITAENSLAEIGDAFYDILFNQDPTLSETVFQSSDMSRVGKALAEMFDLAVKLFGPDQNDMKTLNKKLIDLGYRHARYGVQGSQFEVVQASFFELIAQGLGPQNYTKTAEESWKFVLDHIRIYFLRGLEMGIKDMKEGNFDGTAHAIDAVPPPMSSSPTDETPDGGAGRSNPLVAPAESS